VMWHVNLQKSGFLGDRIGHAGVTVWQSRRGWSRSDDYVSRLRIQVRCWQLVTTELAIGHGLCDYRSPMCDYYYRATLSPVASGYFGNLLIELG
jgi:hypothetical protein